MSAAPINPSPPRWGREDDPDDAVRRILDAAGEVFVERGVLGARMGQVADAAGCSRGTLYRYFAERDELRRAYVNREAGRVAQRVAERMQGGRRRPRSAAVLLVAAIVLALEEVRGDPVLAAWFLPEAATTAALVAEQADVISAVVEDFLGVLFQLARADDSPVRPTVSAARARPWVVRVIVSFLAQPADDEERQLQTFLVPALFAPV